MNYTLNIQLSKSCINCSQGRNLFEVSQKITYVKFLKCKTWVVFSCNHLRWNNIYTFLQIKRIHLITYLLWSRVRICNGISRLPPRSVNNSLPIMSIKEWSLSLENLNRDCSFGCKHMQTLSEGKGIFTFFLAFWVLDQWNWLLFLS